MLFTKLVLIFIKVPGLFIIVARLKVLLRELSTISIKAFLWELDVCLLKVIISLSSGGGKKDNMKSMKMNN